MSTLSFPSARRSAGVAAPHHLSRLWSGAVQAWRTRKAVRAMADLSDAALHDLGIRRGEIEHAARYGRPARG